jgi:hypothetical protein
MQRHPGSFYATSSTVDQDMKQELQCLFTSWAIIAEAQVEADDNVDLRQLADFSDFTPHKVQNQENILFKVAYVQEVAKGKEKGRNVKPS